MTESRSSDALFRRVMDANAEYYRALGTLSKEYWRAMFGVWRDLLGGLPAAITTAGRAVPADRAGGGSAASRDPALVLEAESGQEAQGVFRVENRLTRHVSTPVVTSAFTSRAGQGVAPVLRIVPGTVALAPGAGTMVQIVAVITDDLEPGVDYHGEVYVPDLSERGIPVLIRRRGAAAAETPASPPARRKRRKARRSPSGS